MTIGLEYLLRPWSRFLQWMERKGEEGELRRDHLNFDLVEILVHTRNLEKGHEPRIVPALIDNSPICICEDISAVFKGLRGWTAADRTR